MLYSATIFLFCWTREIPNVSKKDAGSLCSPSYRSASSKGMEEESAVSSRYSVELSLSNPRSGTSSISESKSVGARELFPLRTINLKATSHKDATKVSRNAQAEGGWTSLLLWLLFYCKVKVCCERLCLVFWEILKIISKHINLLAQCKHMHISPPGDWTAVYLCVSPVIDCRPFHGALPLALWQLTPCDPESDRKTDGLMDGEMDGWMTFREQA